MTGVVELAPVHGGDSRVNGLSPTRGDVAPLWDTQREVAHAGTMLAEVLPPERAQVWLAAASGYQYYKVLPFLPSSWEQVQKLATHLKVKLPKKRDAEDDDDVSTEDKFLAAPSRKHREFYLVRSCRKSSKLLTTYQWPLNEHGRATTIFGWGPSTLRKDSRSVNLMNVPKRSKLAKKFRRMIVAAPGHLLVEADAQAIEAVLVGWFAGSPRYIKLAKAGVHGWLTAAYHSKVYALDDPDLPQLCSESKLQWPDDYEKCKRVVHLSNYKGTPIRIAEEYPEEFPTVAAARKLQSFYFETEPGQDIRRWQDKVCLQAAHDCYLENPFKYRHWLYSVSQWDRRRECYVAGDDAKRAIAFLPQSTASACQSEVLLRLAQYEHMRSWLRLIIHDSFLCEPPEADALACAAMLRDEMLAPIPELGGLQIGVEVSVGQNWGEMHKV
jgi:DNA polymerase I-like protein with 3'-5' exonuclease and polymerase domains